MPCPQECAKSTGNLPIFCISRRPRLKITGGWQHWSTIVLGGLVIIVAFCWNYRQVVGGGMPNPFPWSIFLVGEAIGLAGFSLALIRSDQHKHRTSK
jgi:hypothetical protein